MTRERARQIRAVIEAAMSKEDDEVVLENVRLLPEWQSGVAYVTDRKIQYGGGLYKVLHGHTSQVGLEPNAAFSRFARVLIPDPEVIPEWEQPDSTNAYMTGDKVRYNGAVYESLIDNNVWAPDAYPAGWRVVE